MAGSSPVPDNDTPPSPRSWRCGCPYARFMSVGANHNSKIAEKGGVGGNPGEGIGRRPVSLSRTGDEPAITGEPPEERARALLDPDGTARHSRERVAGSIDNVNDVDIAGKRGGTAASVVPV